VAGIDQAFHSGREYFDAFASSLTYPTPSVVDEEDLTLTNHSTGTELVGWTQEICRGIFAADARRFGLTSEGNSVANVIHILPTDEATRIKGYVIRVDGVGHITGHLR
jgi:hypothetical protein